MHNVTETNMAICEALGLEPRRIRKGGVTITLDGALGPVIQVTYQTFHDDDLGYRLEEVLKRYRLVPIDEDTDDIPPRPRPTPRRNPSG